MVKEPPPSSPLHKNLGDSLPWVRWLTGSTSPPDILCAFLQNESFCALMKWDFFFFSS